MGRNAVWPNWGPPRDLVGVLRHMLRSDHGFFTLPCSPGRYDAPTFAIAALLPSFGKTGEILAGLALLAVIPLVGKTRKHPRTVSFAILGNLVLALIFLCLATAPFGPRDSRAHLERFLGLAVIPLAVLLGIGADSIRSLTADRIAESIRKLVLAVFVGGFDSERLGIVDGLNRRIADLYREAIALDLPSNAAWVAFSDSECDYGVSHRERCAVPGPGRRHREASGKRVAPVVEPRFAGIGLYETMPESLSSWPTRKGS